MNTVRLAQARRLFRNDLAPRSTVRHNVRAWVSSVRILGTRWHLAVPVRLVKETP
jgi:hypothetical protein